MTVSPTARQKCARHIFEVELLQEQTEKSKEAARCFPETPRHGLSRCDKPDLVSPGFVGERALQKIIDVACIQRVCCGQAIHE